MRYVFQTILNMSLIASYCIVAVIVLRLFLKRQPKILSYLLWIVVLFRLLCPFSISSNYSLMRLDMQMISRENIAGWNADTDKAGEIEEWMTAEMQEMNGTALQETGADNQMAALTDSVGMQSQIRMQKILDIAAWIWFAGMILLVCYSIGTTFRLHHFLDSAVWIEENQYEAEGISTPFVFGIIRPRIYLPAQLKGKERKYVLEHERTHIVRKDYLVKILAYGTACIHWFNPLVWLAFVLMENDMEMSCDEAVLRKMGVDIKKEYSMSLLSLSTERVFFKGSPLAFGEGKVKGRIRNILSYRKRTIGAFILAAVVLIIIGTGLLLNPAKEASVSTQSAEAAAIEEEETDDTAAFVEAYANAYCSRNAYTIIGLYADEDTALANEITLDKTDGVYTFGYSSPWPDSYRYQNFKEEGRADIYYYAWTSDPHVSVWKEEIQYKKIEGAYRLTGSSLEILDKISSKEMFDEAYLIGEEYQFYDYVENGFVEAINYQRENGNSAADNTVYKKPETAAAHILNLTGGEGVAESDAAYQTMVRYTFADGSSVMIPMYQANYNEETGSVLGEPVWMIDLAVWNAKAP